MRLLRLVVLPCAYLCISCTVVAETEWPEVQDISAKFNVSNTGSDILLGVYDRSGDVAYHLSCRSGQVGGSYEYDYKQLFQCKMFPSEKKESNIDILLSEREFNQNHPRAAFNIDANGSCSKHEYFGEKRYFHVRGMMVTLRVSNMKFSPDLATLIKEGRSAERFSFDFDFSVVSVQGADGARSASVPSYCSVSYSIDGKGGLVEKVDMER